MNFFESFQTAESYSVHEYTFTWLSVHHRTCFRDRILLNETGNWYGGATQRTVYWPINQFVTKRQPLIPSDAYK